MCKIVSRRLQVAFVERTIVAGRCAKKQKQNTKPLQQIVLYGIACRLLANQESPDRTYIMGCRLIVLHSSYFYPTVENRRFGPFDSATLHNWQAQNIFSSNPATAHLCMPDGTLIEGEEWVEADQANFVIEATGADGAATRISKILRYLGYWDYWGGDGSFRSTWISGAAGATVVTGAATGISEIPRNY